jgi:demethylmenaquinone methyltransferase/2-methoxy-6-polyprenyl-1,4-benzoquinol methylase
MLGTTNIAVLECDALNTSLPSGCADAVVCAYGLKTLSFADQERLAAELRRLLRPHGVFALLEIELPRSPLLRQPYAFYLCHVVPVIGRLLLGNPDNYRLLGRYLRQFAGAEQLAARIADRGFTVHSYPLFGGCAVALVGMRDGA